MARTRLAIYPQSNSRYDEMSAAGGEVRPYCEEEIPAALLARPVAGPVET